MGNDLNIVNQQYRVTAQLEDNGKLFVMRVKNRKINLQNIESSIHDNVYIKKYKYHQLPAFIKSKHPTLQQFYNFLVQNQKKVEIVGQSIQINYDQKKIQVLFQNVNQQSMIDTQQQNLEHQQFRKEINQSGLGIGIVVQARINQQLSPQSLNNLFNTYKKIMKYNNKQEEVPQDIPELDNLIQMVKEEFKILENDKLGGGQMNIMKKKSSKVGKVSGTMSLEEVQKTTKEMQDEINTLKDKLKEVQKKQSQAKQQAKKYKDQIEILQVVSSPQKLEQLILKDIWAHMYKRNVNNQSSIHVEITKKETIINRFDALNKEVTFLKEANKDNSKMIQQNKQLKAQNNSLKKQIEKNRSQVFGQPQESQIQQKLSQIKSQQVRNTVKARILKLIEDVITTNKGC